MEVSGKICFVIFKNFFDANTSREFLQNPSNFKENEKSSFSAKWYKKDDEREFPEEFKLRINKSIQKYQENFLKNFNNISLNNFPQQPNNFNYYNNSQCYSPMPNMNQGNNIMMSDNKINYNNSNNSNNMNINMTNNNNNLLNSKNKQNNDLHYNKSYINNSNYVNVNNNSNSLMSNNRKNSINSSSTEEMKNTGKFTCRFELQIENDKEFQVARRLIGAKVLN